MESSHTWTLGAERYASSSSSVHTRRSRQSQRSPTRVYSARYSAALMGRSRRSVPGTAGGETRRSASGLRSSRCVRVTSIRVKAPDDMADKLRAMVDGAVTFVTPAPAHQLGVQLHAVTCRL